MDELTGLPELPEDHYWKVSETDFSYPFHSTYDDRKERKFSVGIWARFKVKSMVRKHWWSRLEEEWAEHTNPIRTGYMPELTAEAIREKAEQVLAQWEADKAKHALLGDYPPKKLES